MPVLIAGGIAAIAGLVIFATVQSLTADDSSPPGHIAAELDDSPRLAGQYIPPHPAGNTHFGNEVRWPICTEAQIADDDIMQCYHSNPPTSGPHAASPARFGVLENPAPKESLIHTMEHGAVIIWYNTTDEGAIRELREITQRAINQRKIVTLTFYDEMEEGMIAMTAWTRLDKFPVSELSRTRVERFIDDHQRRYNPEGF
jgi:hypothetical protein